MRALAPSPRILYLAVPINSICFNYTISTPKYHHSTPTSQSLKPITTPTTTTTITMPDSPFPPPALRRAAQTVSALLLERNATVSVAETAAGGLISAALLALPGASKFYKGGVTLYTLESRLAYAGWTSELTKSYNGPTPTIVAGLAEHVRAQLGSTYTIGESGTAGPGVSGSGATRNRQPGYVALAVSSADGTYKRDAETGVVSSGDDGSTLREENMVAFAVLALEFLGEVIEGKAKL
ncbi:hypothetical protein B0T19DRAFT_416069 [Cercophora scortea]|uniref:CinA C-terminal domain-containing protein n=1 Tax=Cercophora scortea TaxID=314031 RepID=A0AAE0IWI3_9PEZI|nr:hypothetical protein B0T19DRAFT_416069 [Cercophora scortea]